MANRWPYNTARWQRLRKLVLTTHPLCVYCQEIGRVTMANEVDHIKTVREAPDLAFDQGNLQPLCKPCHSSVKQQEEHTGVRKGCDVNGVPFHGHWSSK